jgi:hypothetical protein
MGALAAALSNACDALTLHLVSWHQPAKRLRKPEHTRRGEGGMSAALASDNERPALYDAAVTAGGR